MADIKRIATRDSYGRTLLELGREHDDIVVLDADLSGSTRTSMFAKEFPDRFFNCGIAEANMAGIAAGLAACGKTPFISSFAMFAACRAYEQIRNSIAYPFLNVKICATHAGISVGEDGATHQCNEDMAVMSAIPDMVVINPCDDVEACAAVRAAYEYKGPVYMRFGRSAVPVFHNPETYKFSIGKGTILREGSDITIAASGLCVKEAMDAAGILEASGISAEIISMPTIKPLDEELIIASAAKTKRVITVEEHSVVGGLGSAVCNTLSENLPTRVKRLGIQDEFTISGPAAELIKYYGIDGESIAKKASELCS